MGLSADDFVNTTRKGPRCTVTKILDALDDKDRQVLLDVLADKTVQSSTIADVLTANGHKIGDNTISKHRRKGCACER